MLLSIFFCLPSKSVLILLYLLNCTKSEALWQVYLLKLHSNEISSSNQCCGKLFISILHFCQQIHLTNSHKIPYCINARNISANTTSIPSVRFPYSLVTMRLLLTSMIYTPSYPSTSLYQSLAILYEFHWHRMMRCSQERQMKAP